MPRNKDLDPVDISLLLGVDDHLDMQIETQHKYMYILLRKMLCKLETCAVILLYMYIVYMNVHYYRIHLHKHCARAQKKHNDMSVWV